MLQLVRGNVSNGNVNLVVKQAGCINSWHQACSNDNSMVCMSNATGLGPYLGCHGGHYWRQHQDLRYVVISEHTKGV
jgi:hypothetical protein